METKEEDLKFLCWEMGRFMRHVLVSVTICSLSGAYILAVVLGANRIVEANNYIVFILAILASAFSGVSWVLSYHNYKQTQEMQREIMTRLTEIKDSINPDVVKTEKDWEKK